MASNPFDLLAEATSPGASPRPDDSPQPSKNDARGKQQQSRPDWVVAKNKGGKNSRRRSRSTNRNTNSSSGGGGAGGAGGGGGASGRTGSHAPVPPTGDVEERHLFYMFLFRTANCIDFPQYKCPRAKPYTCTLAHYENHLRRRPRIYRDPTGKLRLSYTANLCSVPSLLDCPEGNDCRSSHRVQKEHIYHPSVYKTQYCESEVDEKGHCASFGAHCSKAHGEDDIRHPIYDSTAELARLEHVLEASPTVVSFDSQQRQQPQHLQKRGGRRRSSPKRASEKKTARSASSSPLVRPSDDKQTTPTTTTKKGGKVVVPGQQPEQQQQATNSSWGRPSSSSTSSPLQQQQQQQQGPATPQQQPRKVVVRGSQASPLLPQQVAYVPQMPQVFGQQGMPFAATKGARVDSSTTTEKPVHYRYMYGFRVRACEAWLAGKCPLDNYECFDAHSREPRRRVPQLQGGRFNYIPTRCRYVLEERECPQGAHCRFAHCTEEVIYHPSKYKTQLCQHPLGDDGESCAGYGRHCAKAHGDGDTRTPVFEESGDGQQQQQQVTTPTTTTRAAAVASPFVCAPEDRVSDHNLHMYHYKTKACAGFPWECTCNGFDYHRADERRRGPVIGYVAMACPSVKPYINSEWSDPSVCPRGDDCEYAHTLLELMYHPQVYKTTLCEHFNERQPECVWKRRCAHAHGVADLRDKDLAMEEWKQHRRDTARAAKHVQTPPRRQHSSHPTSPTQSPGVSPPNDRPASARGRGSSSSGIPAEVVTLLLGPHARTTATTTATSALPPSLQRPSSLDAGWGFQRGTATSPVRYQQAARAASPTTTGWDVPVRVRPVQQPTSPQTTDDELLSHSRLGQWTSPIQSPALQANLWGSASTTSPPDLALGSPTQASSPYLSWGTTSPQQQHHQQDGEETIVAGGSGPPAVAQLATASSVDAICAGLTAAHVLRDRVGRDGFPVYRAPLFASVLERHGRQGSGGFRPVRSFDGLVVKVIALPERAPSRSILFGSADDLDESDVRAQTLADIDTLLDISSHSGEHFSVRYFHKVVDTGRVIITMESFPRARSLEMSVVRKAVPEGRIRVDAEDRRVVQQLLTAVESLHRHHIVHGGICPRSILLLDGRIVLDDIQRSYLRSAFQMSAWDAPEISTFRSRTRYTRAADMFAVGCVVYWLLTRGRHPFDKSGVRFLPNKPSSSSTSSVSRGGGGGGEDEQEEDSKSPVPFVPPSAHEGTASMRVVANICHYNREGDALQLLDPLSADLVHGLLREAPEQRLTAAEASRHPFLWSAQQRLQLMRAVVSDDNGMFRHSALADALDGSGPLIIGSDADWATRVHRPFLECPPALHAAGMQSLGNVQRSRVSALLRFTRGWMAIIGSEADHRRRFAEVLGQADASADDVVAYVCGCFPHLFITTYEMLTVNDSWRMWCPDLAHLFSGDGNGGGGGMPPPPALAPPLDKESGSPSFLSVSPVSSSAVGESLSHHRPRPVSYRQIRDALMCPVLGRHMLREPVLMPCCGASVCKQCLTDDSCAVCGEAISREACDRLRGGVVVQALARIVDLLEHKNT